MMKFMHKLRLIDVPRYGAESEEFPLNEDEMVIDVQWFRETVSVTVAEITYRED